MEEFITIFTKYIKDNYDTDNALIIDKYYHSLRVASIMLELAQRKGLNDNETLLAFVIGLFHDLGRFYEVKRNNRFNNKALDHGAYSNKILYNDNFIAKTNFMRDEEIDLIIRKALYYHNKKDLDLRVKTEKENLYVKLLRDADKIDILRNRIAKGNLFFKDNPTGYLIRNFMSDQTIDLRFLKNKSDTVIFYLSFLKDLYFSESMALANEEKLLEKFQEVVVVGESNKKLYDVLIEHIKEKMALKGDEKIRKINYNIWRVNE